MSDIVKLIIEIPKVPKNDHERWVLAHGIPLDTVKAEIANATTLHMGMVGYVETKKAIEILDSIGKGE
jgi:hypothetical protein